MRRLTWLSLLLLALDQATKAMAQVLLEGRELLLVDGFGLTYVTNPGVWIWPTIPPAVILLVHTLAVAGWVAAVVGWRWYRRWYRDSLAVDLAVAALAVTAFGNLIDRLLVGAARDWWVTPIAIANLVDNTHWLALAAIVWGCGASRRHGGSPGRPCTSTLAGGLHPSRSVPELSSGTSVGPVPDPAARRVARAALA